MVSRLTDLEAGHRWRCAAANLLDIRVVWKVFPLQRPAGPPFQSEPLPDRNWAPGVWVRVRVWQHSLWQVVSFPATPALFRTVCFVGPSLLRFLIPSKPGLVVYLEEREFTQESSSSALATKWSVKSCFKPNRVTSLPLRIITYVTGIVAQKNRILL